MKFKASVFRESQRRVILEKRNSLIGNILILFSVPFLIIDYLNVFMFIAGSTSVFYFLWTMIRWNKLEPSRGSFPFDMIISEEGIQLGRKLFPYNEIKITKFGGNDFKRRQKNLYLAFIKYPAKSNGTENYLNFNYQESEYKLRFRIDNRRHLEEAAQTREFLKNHNSNSFSI